MEQSPKRGCVDVACPASYYACNTCIESMDRPLMKDDECECCNYRGEPCCAGCSCFFLPFTIPYDIISFPVRMIIGCCKNLQKDAGQPTKIVQSTRTDQLESQPNEGQESSHVDDHAKIVEQQP